MFQLFFNKTNYLTIQVNPFESQTTAFGVATARLKNTELYKDCTQIQTFVICE